MRTATLAAALCLSLLAAGPSDPPAKPAPPTSRPATLDLSATLRQLPKEARPPKSGWDEFTQPKAHKWLAGQLVGKPVTIAAKLKSVEVERIPNRTDPDQTEAWRQTLTLEPVAVKGLPFPATQSVVARLEAAKPDAHESPDLLIAYVTEAEARQAKDWKAGQTMFVVGDVVAVEIDGDSFVVALVNCTAAPAPKK